MLRPETTHRRPDRIDAAIFAAFADRVRRASGIVLGPDKQGMVRSRLERLAKKHGFTELSAFLQHLSTPRGARLLRDAVDELTTNHTYFWRESEHFRMLGASVLPGLRTRLTHPGPARIWCAAASTGQEPWTLAGLVHDATFGTSAAGCILATDLSVAAVTQARAGEYAPRDVARLPTEMAERWLEAPVDREVVRVRDVLRPIVRFQTANLLHAPPVPSASVDVVFCRNVLIYFTTDTRSRVIGHLRRSLKRHGLLFVSNTERLPADVGGFDRVAPGVYRRRAS